MKIIDAHAHVAQYVAGFTSRGELRAVGGGKAQYSTGEIFQLFPPEMGGVGVTPYFPLKLTVELRHTAVDIRRLVKALLHFQRV